MAEHRTPETGEQRPEDVDTQAIPVVPPPAQAAPAVDSRGSLGPNPFHGESAWKILRDFFRMGRSTAVLLVAFLLVGAAYVWLRDDPAPQGGVDAPATGPAVSSTRHPRPTPTSTPDSEESGAVTATPSSTGATAGSGSAEPGPGARVSPTPGATPATEVPVANRPSPEPTSPAAPSAPPSSAPATPADGGGGGQATNPVAAPAAGEQPAGNAATPVA